MKQMRDIAVAAGLAAAASLVLFTATQNALPPVGAACLAWVVAAGAGAGAAHALRQAGESPPSAVEVAISGKADPPPVKQPESDDERKSSSLLLANMSHEIWTPVNGVLGMARMLMTTELTGEQRTYARSVVDSADKLAATITDLVDHSKLEAGVLDCAVAPFDLRDIVDAQVKAHMGKARKKGLQLGYRVEFLLPDFMLGSAPRIGQCLGYLLDNAVKFTDSGEISLNVGSDERKSPNDPPQVRFSVSDTGPGIPADQQEAVFTPYHQVDASTTRRHEGVGLGLTITRQLVELMGGRLWTDSRVGRGSTFHFTLPLPVYEGEVEPLADALATRISRQTLLLASSDADLIRQVGEMLRHWSMKSTTVGSIEDALKAFEGQAPDILMLDSDLPGDDIALFHTASNGKILLLAGGGLDGESLPYHRKFGVQLLGKPVSQSELWNALLPSADKADLSPEAKRGIPALRILLVEDNVVNQNLAMMMLKSYGHDVKVAANGEEALSMFEVFPFDLILMDVQMPVMDGLEATRRIREVEASAGGEATPILALTAHALKGDRERCLAAGMNGYLTKPISEAQLWATVSTAIPPGVLKQRWAEQEKLAQRPSAEAEAVRAVAGPPTRCFERSALLARVGGNEANLRKIVELYMANGPALFRKVHEAVTAGDLAGAARDVHTFKGTLLSIAAQPAADLAAQLEELLSQGASTGEFAAVLARLEVALEELRVELAKETGVPA